MVIVFELYSDLHIETRSLNKQSSYPQADRNGVVLLLAGDVFPAADPAFAAVLKKLKSKYPLIVHVPGNHEYYEPNNGRPMTMQKIDQKLRSLKDVIPYVPLNPGVLDLKNNVRIIGCTMWTNIPPEKWKHAQESMNDYNYIHVEMENGQKRKLLAEDVARIHAQQRRWLIHALLDAEKHKKRVVVITHHAPVSWLRDTEGKNNPKNTRNSKNSRYTRDSNLPFYYSTDLEDIVHRFGKTISVWAYGHTHEAKEVHSEVVYLNNGRGYPEQKTGYKQNAVFSLK